LLFFISGVFGALLDNAAVYMSFAASTAARYNVTIDQTAIDENGSSVGFLYVFFREHPIDAISTIRALSAGSVLMGGCTLIGNAPNIVIAFMATRYAYRTRNGHVRSYIEQIGFVRQMLTACIVLTPVFCFVAFRML
jgi:Na+/H+ antiporter NhaD/arsenite permease-like protein